MKSLTARESFVPPFVSRQASKGRAYVISVGVNAYENEDWDLRFAANDARRLQEAVASRVASGGEYEEVVSVPLISDYATENGRKTRPRVVREMNATKRHFEAVLDLLAGRKVDEDLLKSIPNADKLRRATPEDLVLVSFSSHGYADERGSFYLFASDTGASDSLSEALKRAVSSSAALGGDDSQARVVILSGDGANAAEGERGVRVSGQPTRTQQPALFDFARRRRDSVLARAR